MKTLIVGGGLLGLTTAKVLQRDHHEVEVLETRNEICQGASYANGGMLTASMSDPWNAPGVHRRLVTSLFDRHSPMKARIGAIPSLLFWGLKFVRNSSRRRYLETAISNYRLARYAVWKTARLRDEIRMRYDASCRGALKIFRDRQAMRDSIDLALRLSNVGLRFVELDGDRTLEVEPQLAGIRGQVAGGLYFPEDECGDALLFCRSLANEIEKDGGVIRPGIEALSLVVKGSRVVGVETEGGLIEAGRVVLAAGVHSGSLLKGVGISLPIKPVKGYSLTFDVGDFSGVPKVPVIDEAMHAAVTPLGRRLRIVGTAEFAGYDTAIQPERIDNLFNLLQWLYPGVAARVDRAQALSWAGLRPVSCDGKPFIGPCGIKGLYLNVGHGHLGWTMAMGSAHVLADLMAGRHTEVDSEPFRVHR